MIKAMPVVGVRPQIIKAAPLIMEMQRDPETEIVLVHSGQHYDYEMSKVFFKELDLPDPKYNLNVKSGSHAEQTAKIMLKMEWVLEKEKPDVVIVFGDANTTLAAALAAVKLKMPVVHIEAGLRSWDFRMPEEINRVLTDHISQVLYAPTEFAVEQLMRENISRESITLSGDTMYDSILLHKHHIEESNIITNLSVETNNYIVATTHRAENVDNPDRLRSIIKAFIEISNDIKIVFPIHPRTLNRLNSFQLYDQLRSTGNIVITKPVGYFDMLRLIKEARAVITDSGGIQKEAFILRTPCITLRERTEWIETIRLGGNILVGANYQYIVDKTRYIVNNFLEIKKRLDKVKMPYGDGQASKAILTNLKERHDKGELRVTLISSPIKEFLL